MLFGDDQIVLYDSAVACTPLNLSSIVNDVSQWLPSPSADTVASRSIAKDAVALRALSEPRPRAQLLS